MDGVLSPTRGTTSGGTQDQNARNQGSPRLPTHSQEIEQPTYVQQSQRVASPPIYQEPRQEPPAVRFQAAQEGTTTGQETPVYGCSCNSAHHDHPARSSSTSPPPEPRPRLESQPISERTLNEGEVSRRAEGRDPIEGSSNPSQESGTVTSKEMKLSPHSSMLAKDKGFSSNPDPSAPPQRPPKDRWPPSRVSSGTTTILLDTLPTLPRDSRNDGVQGLRGSRMGPSRQQSGIDYFVPVDLDEKTSYSRLPRSKLTVSERFQPTLDAAKETREKLAKKAKNTKYIQNGAIGLQVLLGSLTTGLSAVATTGRQMAVQTTILGGLTTIVASYLAKTRNSDEAEKCRARVSELDKFIRTGTAFLLDYGHSDDPIHDKVVEELRSDFEELLGNGAIEKHQVTPDAKV